MKSYALEQLQGFSSWGLTWIGSGPKNRRAWIAHAGDHDVVIFVARIADERYRRSMPKPDERTYVMIQHARGAIEFDFPTRIDAEKALKSLKVKTGATHG